MPILDKMPESNFGSSSGFSMSQAMPYVGALSSVIGTLGNVSAMKSQANTNIANINYKRDAILKNIDSRSESLEYSQASREQQLEDLNRVVGDRLSASGMEALKAEARLKAASAETGATGTTIGDAVATADVNRLHRDATILRAYDIQRANTLQSLVADRLNFTNEVESMVSGQFPSMTGMSTTGAIASGLNTGLSGFMSGLSFLSDSQREEFYGINITGEA